jgi:hypothetical protein
LAGDWIKLEHATLDKPEVLELAELLHVSHGDALLLCLRFWVWLDQQSDDGAIGRRSCRRDGRRGGVSKTALDALMRCPGITNALIYVGWLEEVDGVLAVPNFGRHNGETSKKRVLKNQRQANWRRGGDESVDVDVDVDVDGGASRKASTREEKRRDSSTHHFAEFWRHYPKKVGKHEAQKAFLRLHPDASLLDRMLKALAVACASDQWRRDDGKFIPHASTWLNNRRFDDVVEPPADRPLRVAL